MSQQSISRAPIVLVPLAFIILGYVVYPSLTVLWESFFRDGVFTLINYAEFFDLDRTVHLEALLNLLSPMFSSVEYDP